MESNTPVKIKLSVKKTNLALSAFYKSVLNSQYGKYGQKQFNKSAIVKTNDDLKKILKTTANQ